MNIKPIVLFASLLISVGAWAQELTTIGISTESFDYVATAQEREGWCWAASSQMVLHWFHADVEQVDLVHRVKGRVINQAGSEQDITTALDGVPVRYAGGSAVIHTASAAGAPDPLVMLAALGNKNPIVLAVDTGPRTGHAVVLTAATYYRSQTGPKIVSLVIRDPYPSPSNIRNKGRMEISGPALRDFLLAVRRNWVVWVTPTRIRPDRDSATSRQSARLR